MKVPLGRETCIQVVILVGCNLEIQWSQGLVDAFLMQKEDNVVSRPLFFASVDYLDGKILKLRTVFTFVFSAECNKASELQHQSDRDDSPGGQTECFMTPVSKVKKKLMTVQILV